MKNKNGFTLIELLAVIVILAIITLIATPIILNIINSSRENAAKQSAELIINEVELAYSASYMSSNGVFPTIEKIYDKFSMEGATWGKNLVTGIISNKITDGFKNECIVDISTGSLIVTCNNDEYESIADIKTEDGMTLTVLPGTQLEETNPDDDSGVDTETGGGTGSGTGSQNQSTNTGDVVYYDVYNGVGCTKSDYHEDNSKTGYNGITTSTDNQTSCLKFYAIPSSNSENANLLLDHNTTAVSYWNSTAINSTIKEVLTNLKNATKDWKGTITPEDYYNGRTTIKYAMNGVKARLITADEIANITGADVILNWSESTAVETDWYLFHDKTQEGVNGEGSDCAGSCQYSWLIDRTNPSCNLYGCEHVSDVTTQGYWTATAMPTSKYRIWYVEYTGIISSTDADFRRGVRPVIIVPKANL